MLDVLNEPKTWSEIKLRKPSAEICDTMQFIISEFSEISASKALEKLILNYPRQKKKFRPWRLQKMSKNKEYVS